jgi:hypothetical protein
LSQNNDRNESTTMQYIIETKGEQNQCEKMHQKISNFAPQAVLTNKKKKKKRKKKKKKRRERKNQRE